MKNWFLETAAKLAEIKPTVWIILGVLVVASIVMIVMTAKSKKSPWTANQLAIGAICIALAFVLSYIRLFHMPQGGSITLASMLPIMVFAYIYGVPKGLVVGLAYGVLQLIQDAWIVHPVQVLFDYGIAFMALALAGAFKKYIVPGMILAGIVRYVAHVTSGVIFFAEYAPEGQHVWVYSSLYNSFVFVDLAICIIVVLIPPVMGFIKKRKAQLL